MDRSSRTRGRSRRRAVCAGVVLGLVCSLGAGGIAGAQAVALKDAVEPMAGGLVNWSTGWVKATGLGAPPPNMGPGQARAMAQRAAYTVAMRNLLEVVKGVRVDSQSLVENFIVTNDVIKTQVSGFIRGAQVDKTDSQPDGGVEVTVKVPLYGVDSLITPFLDEKGVRPRELPPERPDQEGATGLVVDARGLGVKPACLPTILDEEGTVLYGPGDADRSFVQQGGMAQYKTAPKEADLSSLLGAGAVIIRPVQVSPAPPREGRRPLKIKGTGRSGVLKANVMISSEDAKKIRDSPGMAAALRRSRVVIVTDPLIGGMEGRAPAQEGLVASAR